MSEPEEAWPTLPTETEIYILPNGEIVVADLPAELAAHLNILSPTSSHQVCDVESPSATALESTHVADQ